MGDGVRGVEDPTIECISKQPVRIAYIIGKMWAGGVEAVVFNYYRAIDHSKFQFDFYYDEDSTVEPPQALINMGARFIMLPPYQKILRYIKELRKYLRAEKYMIVHSHLNTISVFPLYVAWKEHIPVRIAHNHSVPGGKELLRNGMKQVLRHLPKIFSTDYFACSEKAGRWMFGDKDFNNGKVYIVKNAIDFNRFKITDDEVEKKKRDLGLENKFVVGHIGRFTYAKNHSLLLDIFKEIAKCITNAVLLLVGDGELHDEIVKGINQRNLEDKVVMVGKVCDPERYYRLNNVIILPSVFEGLSMTTIESQISGVPVVISKAIPTEAVISNGCTYMDISESPVKWAEAAINVSSKKMQNSTNAISKVGQQIELWSESKAYNINFSVKNLEKKYDALLRD